MNKNQLIAYLSNGGKVRVVTPGHKAYGIDRTAEKVQTNSIRFSGGSWLYFKDIKPEWIYNQGFKISDLMGGFIEYVYIDMDKALKGDRE